MNATPALDDFAQRARWRSFLDPALEAEYRLWHRDQILPVARLVGLVSLVLWLLIPLWFRVFFGDVPSVIFLSAFVVAVPTFSLLLVLSYTALNRWTNLAVAIANVVGEDHIGIGTDNGPLPLLLDEKAKAELRKWALERIRQDIAAPGEGVDVYPMVAEYNSIDRYRRFAADLQKRGWSERRLEKLMGANFLRVYREAWSA